MAGPAGAVGVERHGEPVSRDDGAAGGQDGRDALAAVPELGVEQPLGGVVDDGDEREPAVGDGGQPAMAAAVEMEQLTEARARLAPAAMAPPRAMLADQAGGLQGLLDEGIAERHAVLAAGELVEVADVEALVAVAVEREQALHLGHGGGLGGGDAAAAIEQPVIASLLEPPAPAAHGAGAEAEDLGGMNPGELPSQGLQDDFLRFHGALHGAGEV